MARTKISQSRTSHPVSPKLLSLARETSVYLLTAMTLYLVISLVSYSPVDPSWMHTDQPGHISNLGGRFGAGLSSLLFLGFGHISYVFPLLLGGLTWRAYQHRRQAMATLQHRLITLGGFVLFIVGATGIENGHYPESGGGGFISGGVFGEIIHQSFMAIFGFMGTTLFLLTMCVTGITWFSRLSWFGLMDRLGKGIFDLVEIIYRWITMVIDYFEGKRARKVREHTVTVRREKQKTRKPPRIEPKIISPETSGRLEREKQSTLFADENESATLPPLADLDPSEPQPKGFSHESLETMSRLLEKKLADFNIDAEVVAVHPGPVITRFEIDPAPGIKSSQIAGLSKDLARALSVISVRVVDNIPGKTVIGLEIPNEQREIVRLIDGLSSQAYEESKTPLALMLGKDIGGLPVIADLGRMPHLLIAGTTGSGKSVCINALILSILYKATPEQVRLIMVDPKMLELSIYEGIPHLLAPVVTDMKEASNALRWCIAEMERRFKLLAQLGVRNIASYNRKVAQAIEKGEPLKDPFAEELAGADELKALPYVVVVIDELADLMMVVGKKIEELITRIAQRARAAGIHLILATQRPSVDVITGLIKANIPTRIAFQVSARADSRTILDQIGAEQLLGHGDMLYLPPGTAAPVRVHGALVSDQEVQRVVSHLKTLGPPDYHDDVLDGSAAADDPANSGGSDGGEEDELYDQAVYFVTETRRASISAVQRQLRVGYNRAARMIESMELAGVVGPLESNGRREVLAPPPQK